MKKKCWLLLGFGVFLVVMKEHFAAGYPGQLLTELPFFLAHRSPLIPSSVGP